MFCMALRYSLLLAYKIVAYILHARIKKANISSQLSKKDMKPPP